MIIWLNEFEFPSLKEPELLLLIETLLPILRILSPITTCPVDLSYIFADLILT